MESAYWHKRWEENDISFHARETNALLNKYFPELSLAEGSRVFVPLCGKTLDIAWLLAKGYQVVGAELNQMAVEQLFTELGAEPTVSDLGNLKVFSAKSIDVFVGDIFDLSSNTLGTVDAIYDRAALVALPAEMRSTYTKHLMAITQNAPQLLICFEYDQSQMPGPPFSIDKDEVHMHYGKDYQLTELERNNVKGGLKGQCPASENAWLLQSLSL